MQRRRTTLVVLCLVSCWIQAQSGGARFDAGEIVGSVSNTDGKNLSEVIVRLSLGEEAWEVVTDDKGLFHFGDLKPGNYTIQVAQEGYSEAVYEPVNIRLGRVTTVSVRMSETIEETIVVTSEPPAVTAGLQNVDAKLDAGELTTIPIANDPWSIGAREAGILTGGRDTPSGERTTVGTGSAAEINYSVDGTDVTSRGSVQRSGSRPAFSLSRESLRAVEVTTGSSDLSLSSPGPHINLLTARGENRTRLSARIQGIDRDWQASSSGAPGSDLTIRRILGVTELGVEAGGSLLRDHLWGWASVENREIREEIAGIAQETQEKYAAVKLNSQLGGSSTAIAYHRGDRDQSGEGAGIDRALETTLFESEPSELFRVENTHIFHSDLYLTARYAEVSSGTARVPQGVESDPIVLSEDGIWRGSFGEFLYGQDSDSWLLDGATFHRVGDFGHQIRFGFSHRQSSHSTSERWGPDSSTLLLRENFGTPFDIVRLERPIDINVEQTRAALWLQDSITAGRWTADFGFRYDSQQGTNAAGQADSNPLFPDLLPALDFSGGGTVIDWVSLSPRFAAAYAFGEEGRTVAHASVSLYASQLYADLVSRASPATDAEIYLGFEDTDRDNRFDRNEPHFLLGSNGIDLGSPSRRSPHATDTLLNPERTDEIRLGIEHRFLSGFELSLEHVDRQVTGILETRRLLREQSGRTRQANFTDYELSTLNAGQLPDGTPFVAPVYSLREGLEYTGGNLLMNGDREQQYKASTLSFSRQLENRWALRGRLTWSDWRWHLGPEFGVFDDPTDLVEATSNDAAVSLADSAGDIVATSVAGESLLLNSRWSFNVFALYQLAPQRRWGFDAAVNLRGREGFPLPYSVSVVEGGELLEVQATKSTDSYRLEDVFLLDLRLEKEFRLGPKRASVSLDVFNLLNAGYVLERERQLNSPLSNQISESLSPRALRFGLRLALD